MGSVSRNISEDLRAAFASPVSRLTMLVRVTRRDGLTIGMTDADAAVVYAGTTYLPTDSGGASASDGATGTGASDMEVVGLLSDERITEADLLAGRYAGAEVVGLIIDREDPSAGHLTLMHGELGDVRTEGGKFTADVRSIAGRLRRTAGEVTTERCRCRRLGDGLCGVDMAGTDTLGRALRQNRTAGASSDPFVIPISGGGSAPPRFFTDGIIRCLSGQNAGLEREVKSHVSGFVSLRLPFPEPVAAGTLLQLDAGCDGRFVTCKRFGNQLRFRGEPHLPGNDKVVKVARGRG